MKNKLTAQDFEDISALIREEEEDGLAFFQTRNFRNRVEIRLEEEAGGRKPVAPFRRIAIPVLAPVLVLIMAGVFILILSRPGAGPPSEFEALTSALGRLPGFSHPPGKRWTALAGQTGTSRLAASVQQVLVAADQEKREEERRISIPTGPNKVPRLSPDQRMEVLFKEKAIERALLFLKDNSKEV